MSRNQKLAVYYATKWNALCQALDDNELYSYEYNPLLLNINNPNDFEKADIKVILFGQDMAGEDEKGWYKYDRSGDILNDCMPAIKTFDQKTGACDIYGRRQTRGMGGGMNMFIDRLNNKFKDKEIRYIWNDIVKIGRNIKWN